MRYRFIDEHRDDWPIRVMCRVLRVSPSGFYAWRHRPVCERAVRRGQLAKKVYQVLTTPVGCTAAPGFMNSCWPRVSVAA